MRRTCWIAVIVLAIVGLLGPLIATERPLAARIGGELRFPAFAAWVGGEAEPPQGAKTWRAWWSTIAEDGEDWVLLAPVPFDPAKTDDEAFYSAPRAGHFCGNDETGRDVLARLVHGASTAAQVAIGVVLLAGVIGVAAGAVAGYCGGVVDVLFLRMVELFLCFPSLVLLICVSAVVTGSQTVVVLVMGSIYWTNFARIVRGEFLSLREREFVKSAQGLGLSPWRVVVRHMLPCVKGQVGIVAAFVAANAIVVEATLRFLGLGPVDAISWGGLLAQWRTAPTDAWHLWVFPGAVIGVTAVALHGLGDGKGRG